MQPSVPAITPVCSSLLLVLTLTAIPYATKLAGGMRMPSWFDIHDAPITSVSQNRPVASLLPCAASSLLLPCVCVRACVKRSVRGEEDVLRAVQIVHTMIDREIASGTGPEDVFVFGLSQGGTYSTSRLMPAISCRSVLHRIEHY